MAKRKMNKSNSTQCQKRWRESVSAASDANDVSAAEAASMLKGWDCKAATTRKATTYATKPKKSKSTWMQALLETPRAAGEPFVPKKGSDRYKKVMARKNKLDEKLSK